MGSCSSSNGGEPPSGSLESKLKSAVHTAKARCDSESMHGSKSNRRKIKPSFNGLLMHFGKMRPGFIKIMELFQALHPDPKTKLIKVDVMLEHADKELRIEATQSRALLNEIGALCKAEGKAHLDGDEFVIVWTILAFEEPSAAVLFPEIKSALDILEKAFTYFDSSLDGTLEREELVVALSSGTRKISAPGNKPKGKKNEFTRKKGGQKGAADMLFDVLDLDNSGSITFQEFLLGIVHIVLSDEMTEEDEEEAELRRDKDEPEVAPEAVAYKTGPGSADAEARVAEAAAPAAEQKPVVVHTGVTAWA